MSLLHYLKLSLTFLIFVSSHFFIIPFYLILDIFQNIAKTTLKFRPDFGKSLKWRDVVLMEDYTKTHRHSGMSTWLFHGSLDLPYIKQLFTQNVLNSKLPNGTLRYPELKQFHVFWMGFPVCKTDAKFSIDNHIHLLDHPSVPRNWDNLHLIFESLALKGYAPGRSPWEMYVVPNFQSSKGDANNTLLILRIHHVYADLFSTLKLVVNQFCQEPITSPKACALGSDNKGIWGDLIYISKWREYLQGLTHLIWSLRANSNFRKNNVSNKVKENVVIRLSDQMKLDDIKMVAKGLKVRVPSVLIGLITASLGKVMKAKEQVFSANYVVPLENHPEVMANHADVMAIDLPIGLASNLSKLVHTVNKSFIGMKSDPRNKSFLYMGYLIGKLGFPLPKILKKYSGLYAPVAITNFSAGQEFSLDKKSQCKNFLAFLSPPEFFMGSVFSVMGYTDTVQIICAVNDTLLTEREVTQVAQEISNVLRDLLKQIDYEKPKRGNIM